MGCRRTLLGGVFVVLTLAVTPAATGAPGGDVHLFQVRVVGTGTAFTDYGREGKDPGLTTGAGVDGTESLGWRWEVLAAAKSVGNGAVISRSETARERMFLKASVVDWSVQMGNYNETPLCKRHQGLTRVISGNGRGTRPNSNSRGEYMRRPTTVAIRRGALIVQSPQFATTFTCFHDIHGHGLKYIEGARGTQAQIPAGAFNPRSDRFFHKVFPRPRYSLPPDHDGDPNSAHHFQAQSQIELTVKAVSERRYRRLGNRYHRAGPGEAAVFDPQ